MFHGSRGAVFTKSARLAAGGKKNKKIPNTLKYFFLML
jgi:hypothetical protein